MKKLTLAKGRWAGAKGRSRGRKHPRSLALAGMAGALGRLHCRKAPFSRIVCAGPWNGEPVGSSLADLAVLLNGVVCRLDHPAKQL